MVVGSIIEKNLGNSTDTLHACKLCADGSDEGGFCMGILPVSPNMTVASCNVKLEGGVIGLIS